MGGKGEYRERGRGKQSMEKRSWVNIGVGSETKYGRKEEQRL